MNGPVLMRTCFDKWFTRPIIGPVIGLAGAGRARRLAKAGGILAGLLWLAACAAPSASSDGDPHLAIRVANTGPQPLRCKVLFGHWVDRDLGTIAPGASVSFDAQQQSADGALYVERADGLRKMMIENIACARDGDWHATSGEIDLAPARSNRETGINADCALRDANSRVVCAPIGLTR
jgi:hypothetical protein